MNDNEIFFKDEFPVSIHNPYVYDETFIIENWMRRIVFVSLMIKKGSRWSETFSKSEIEKFNRNSKKKIDNVVFDSIESSNLLWFTTISELCSIITDSDINDTLEEITGHKPEELVKHLRVLNDIRNIIAHNRIITIETLYEFNQVRTILNEIVKGFKIIFVYNNKYTQQIYNERINANEVYKHFYQSMIGVNREECLAFLGEDKYHYRIISLPSFLSFEYPFVDTMQVLESYEPVMKYITGFFIDKGGLEFSVHWPKHESISLDNHLRIINTFINNRRTILTDCPYEQQFSKSVCNPLFWFYGKMPDDPEGKYVAESYGNDEGGCYVGDITDEELPF